MRKAILIVALAGQVVSAHGLSAGAITVTTSTPEPSILVSVVSGFLLIAVGLAGRKRYDKQH
jgi:hypothetical protein